MSAVQLCNEISRETWNGYCRPFTEAEFTQSYEWGEAKRGQGWQPVRATVVDQDSCLGAFQALRRSYPGVSILYCPRGPLWMRRDTEEAPSAGTFGEVLGALQSVFPDDVVVCDCHFPDELVGDQVLEEKGFSRLGQGMTSWIDLGREEEDIVASFHGKWRNDLRKAQRLGVQVQVGEPLPGIDELYRMLGKMAARKGFEVGVSRQLAHDFLERCPNGKNVLITALNPDRQPVSWALIVSFNGFASYLVGAGLSNRHPAFVRGASNLVQMEAIRWARGTSKSAYNLEGLDPEGNPGVYRFKERMNGEIRLQKGLWIWSRNRIKRKILGAIIKQRMNL